MEIFFEKGTRRKLELLEILYRQNGISLEEIADILDLSKKTVITSINDLTNFLAPWQEEISICKEEHLIYLKKDSHFNLEYIKMQIKKNSFVYSFFTSIFYSEFTHINQFLEKVFYSYSHVYSYKKKLDQFLQHYQLQLDFTNLRLVGKEEQIRLFMFYFYWDIFKGQDFAEAELTEKSMGYIDKLERWSHTKFSSLERQQYKYGLTILAIRVRKKNVIKTKFPLSSSPLTVEYLKQWIAEFLQGNGLTVAEKKDEVDFCYFIFEMRKIAYEDSIASQHEYVPNDAYLYSQFIYEFKQRFYHKDMSEEFLYSVTRVFAYFQYLSGKFLENEIIQRERPIPKLFRTEFSQLYFDFMAPHKNEINGYMELYKILELLFSTIIDEPRYQPEITVQLVVDRMIYDKEQIENKITSLGYNLQMKEEINAEPDLVISTGFGMDANNIFYWDVHPTAEEWKRLNQKLKSIEEEKLAALDLMK